MTATNLIASGVTAPHSQLFTVATPYQQPQINPKNPIKRDSFAIPEDIASIQITNEDGKVEKNFWLMIQPLKG